MSRSSSSAMRVLAMVGAATCVVVAMLVMMTAEGKVTRTANFNVYQTNYFKMECNSSQGFLKVQSAKWSPFSSRCPTVKDKTSVLARRCDNKTKCEVRPHWSSNSGQYLNLGDVCVGIGEYFRGTWTCVSPCGSANCGSGRCTNLNNSSFKCTCNTNFVNQNATQNGTCIRSKCFNNPCGSNGRCSLTNRNNSYSCACNTGYKFMGGTCKAYDMCSVNNGGCPKGANCTDGMGKVPKCSCPDFMHVARGSCIATDTCKTNNGGCPREAKCVDGVGKKASCQCPEFFVYDNSKCQAVDQCATDNGGCDKMAKCSDGVGKQATCTCPNYYEMDKDDKCVDIDECKEKNGGCNANAECINKIGKPNDCQCKKGYAGDGVVDCLKVGSFIMPDNGTVKVTMAQAKNPVTVELEGCMNVKADPRTGRVDVNVAHNKFSKVEQMSEKYEEANLIFLLHRSGKEFMTYVYSGKHRDFSEKPVYVKSAWKEDCRIDRVTVEGAGSVGYDTTLYRTNNIASDVTEAQNNPAQLGDDQVVVAKPVLPGAFDKNENSEAKTKAASGGQ